MSRLNRSENVLMTIHICMSPITKSWCGCGVHLWVSFHCNEPRTYTVQGPGQDLQDWVQPRSDPHRSSPGSAKYWTRPPSQVQVQSRSGLRTRSGPCGPEYTVWIMHPHKDDQIF